MQRVTQAILARVATGGMVLTLLSGCSSPDTPADTSPSPTQSDVTLSPVGTSESPETGTPPDGTPPDGTPPDGTPPDGTPSGITPTPAGPSPTPGFPTPTRPPGGPTPLPTDTPSDAPTGTPTDSPTATPPAGPVDGDNDGYPSLQDCNDANSSIHPGATELCDDLDNDCDGQVDDGVKITYYYDNDKDGFGSSANTYVACTAPLGYVALGGDCNDFSATSYPGASEICDTIDNDCDGTVDEGFTSTWYYDGDKDGYGQPALTLKSCTQPAGYVANGGDCNDQDAGIHPGVTDTCDGKDSDCDSAIDEDPEKTWYRDADGDGYGTATSSTRACSTPTGYVANATDCNDSATSAYPGAMEVCDGIDNDCDLIVDDGFSQVLTWYYDGDKDGFGIESTTISTACPSGATWARARGDCQDSVAAVHPGATDFLGDLTDSDCGGMDGADPHVGLTSASYASLGLAMGASKTGQTIWVGPGTYYERDLNFNGRSVAIRATQVGDAVVDAESLGRHFMLISGESAQALIDGFTLKNGNGAYFMAGDGGSILISYSAGEIRSSTLMDCQVAVPSVGGGITINNATDVVEVSDVTVERSYAKYGGGMAVKYSDAWIHDCTFSDNLATNGGGGLDFYSSTGVTERVLLVNNDADFGGGIYGYMVQSTSLWSNLVFISNTAATYGGGLDLTSSSNPVAQNLYFYGNWANNGGAIATAFSANPTLSNVRAWYNAAAVKGGAIYSEEASPKYYHLVATSNTAQLGGGVYVGGSTTRPTIQYSILAYNSEYNLYNSEISPAMLSLLNSDLYAPTGNNHNLSVLDSTVLTIDPMFQGMSGGVPSDHHLSKSSTLVNRGGSAAGLDVDASLLDLGAYGGAKGGSWDRDFDGSKDYFWPGAITDAPNGYSASAFDCSDGDASKTGC